MDGALMAYRDRDIPAAELPERRLLRAAERYALSVARQEAGTLQWTDPRPSEALAQLGRRACELYPQDDD